MATQPDAKTRVTRAKIRLLTQSCPFFGMILMSIKFIESDRNTTAWTDGQTLGYAPAHIQTLSDSEIETLLAHEASHIVSNHPFRMKPHHNHQLANVAQDHVVDLNLYATRDKAGKCPFTHNGQWQTPDAQYTGMAWEEVYSKLENKQKQDQQNGTKAGAGTPGAGEVFPYPAASPAELQEAEAANIQAITQAAQAAEKYGNLPADVAQLIKDLRKPVVHWAEQLRQFMTRSNNEFTWKTPRRRALAAGMYLPAKTGTKCPPLVVVRDTSGSTTAFAPQFTAEIAAIHADMKPDRLVILDVDSRVAHVHDFEPFDTVPGNLKMYGGGGTRFAPAFAWVDANMDEPPAALVYLTDLDGPDPVDVPPYPVLWVSTDKRALSLSFGERIDMTT